MYPRAAFPRITIFLGILLVVVGIAFLGSRYWRPRHHGRVVLDPLTRSRMEWMRWYWVAVALVCLLVLVYLARRSTFPFHDSRLQWFHHREGLNIVALLVTLAGYPFALRAFLAWRRRTRERNRAERGPGGGEEE